MKATTKLKIETILFRNGVVQQDLDEIFKLIESNDSFSCYLEDSEEGARCVNQCNECKEYKGEL